MSVGLIHLPEPFGVWDEQVGVWWVAMAARHLNRTGTIPGSCKERKHSGQDTFHYWEESGVKS